MEVKGCLLFKIYSSGQKNIYVYTYAYVDMYMEGERAGNLMW